MLQHFYPFLASLGWALINSLWQCALLWVLYKFVFSIHTQARATERNAAATSLLFAGFTWFLISLINRFSYLQSLNEYAITNDHYLAIAQRNNLFKEGFSVSAINSVYKLLLPYLSVIYLVVLSVLSARLLVAYRYTRKLSTTGLQKIEIDYKLYVQKMASWIGIRKEVKIYLSELIDVPATVGYLKPIILLPVATFNNLSTEQAESILLHELAHIKRSDYLLNILTSVIETILFFNPFARMLSKSIRKEREHSCDDLVLQLGYHARTYAEALLSLEQQRMLQHQYAIAATGRDTELLSRVKRILNIPHKERMKNNLVIVLFLFTISCMISLAWAEPGNGQHAAAKKKISADQLYNTSHTIKEIGSFKQMPDVVLTARKKNVFEGMVYVVDKTLNEGNPDDMSEQSLYTLQLDGQTLPEPAPVADAPSKELRTTLMYLAPPPPPAPAGLKATSAAKRKLEAQFKAEKMLYEKTMKEKYLVWDYEVEQKVMEEYQKEALKAKIEGEKAMLDLQKNMKELNRNIELKAIERMPKTLSSKRVNLINNAPASFSDFVEFTPPLPVSAAGKSVCSVSSPDVKPANVRIYKNGTVVVTITSNGTTNSKAYTIEINEDCKKDNKEKNVSTVVGYQYSDN